MRFSAAASNTNAAALYKYRFRANPDRDTPAHRPVAEAPITIPLTLRYAAPPFREPGPER
jgi:hypothetical protein